MRASSGAGARLGSTQLCRPGREQAQAGGKPAKVTAMKISCSFQQLTEHHLEVPYCSQGQELLLFASDTSPLLTERCARAAACHLSQSTLWATDSEEHGHNIPSGCTLSETALRKMPCWWQEFTSHHQCGQGQEPTSYHQETLPRNGAGLILPVTGEFPCTCSPGTRHLPAASSSRPSSAALQMDPAPQGVGWVTNQCPQQDPRAGGDRSWLRDCHAHIYKRLSEILKRM